MFTARHSSALPGHESPQVEAYARLPLEAYHAEYGFTAESAALAYAALVGIWDKEADRFWVRSNLMRLINGALLGFTVGAETPPFIRIVVSLFGLYFSLVWVLMNNKGGYYVSRWRPMIEEFESVLRLRLGFPG